MWVGKNDTDPSFPRTRHPGPIRHGHESGDPGNLFTAKTAYVRHRWGPGPGQVESRPFAGMKGWLVMETGAWVSAYAGMTGGGVR